MKKILMALLSVALLTGCGGGGGTGGETGGTTGGETGGEKKVYNVAYVVNGNLGDKSFFDSAQGLKET